MAMQHSSTNDAFTPQDFGKLLNTALQSESVALQVSTVVKTDKVLITLPDLGRGSGCELADRAGLDHRHRRQHRRCDGDPEQGRRHHPVCRTSWLTTALPRSQSWPCAVWLTRLATPSIRRSSAIPRPTARRVCCQSRPRRSIPARRSPTPIRSWKRSSRPRRSARS